MATTGRELPVPLPLMGVRVDVPPSLLGIGGLADGLNLLPRDSRIVSRPGTTLLTGDEPAPVNLLTDMQSNPYVGAETTTAPTGFTKVGADLITFFPLVPGTPDRPLFGTSSLRLTVDMTTSARGIRTTINTVSITGGNSYTVGIWLSYLPTKDKPIITIETYDAEEDLLGTTTVTVPTTKTQRVILVSASFTAEETARYSSIKIMSGPVYPEDYEGLIVSLGMDMVIAGMMLSQGDAPLYWMRGGSPSPGANLMAQVAASPQTTAEMNAAWSSHTNCVVSPTSALVWADHPMTDGSLNLGPYGIYGENLVVMNGTSMAPATAETAYANCPVDALTDYVVSVFLVPASATIIADDLTITIRYYDSGGSYLSSDSVSGELDPNLGYARIWQAITTPASCAFLTLKVVCASVTGAAALGPIKVHAGTGEDDWSIGMGVTTTGPHVLGERIAGAIQYDYIDTGVVTSRQIVICTDTTWWLYDATNGQWTDIGDGTLDGEYNQAIFRTYEYEEQTWLLGCNGESKIKKWDGDASEFDEITDAPIAKCMAIAGTRVIAGNVTYGGVTYPNGIVYSAPVQAGAFDTWAAASIIILGDTMGEIVAMLEMGDQMTIVYMVNSIYALVNQSGLYPLIATERATNVSGPVSPLAVVGKDQNTHLYLGRDGAVYLFDGSSPRSLGPHIQQYIRTTMDFTYAARSYLTWDDSRSELWVWYPRRGHGGTIHAALVLQLGQQQQDGTFSCWPMRWSSSWDFSCGLVAKLSAPLKMSDLDRMGDVTAAMGDLMTLRADLMLLGSDGKTHTLDGVLDGTEAIEVVAQTGIFTMGGSHLSTVKEIDHYFARVPSDQIVRVRLLSLDHGEKPWPHNAGLDAELQLSREPPFTSEHRQTAAAFALQYRALVENPLDYSGAMIHYAIRGRR